MGEQDANEMSGCLDANANNNPLRLAKKKRLLLLLSKSLFLEQNA